MRPYHSAQWDFEDQIFAASTCTLRTHPMLTTLGAKISAHPFQHGSIYEIGKFKLVSSYHCSRYNTNTRVLTPEMFRAVFGRVREYLDGLA